jgi:hypothetical protein
MNSKIAVDWVLCLYPCRAYTQNDAELLRRLLPDAGLTPLQVADLAEVSAADRLWVLLRENVIPVYELRLLACAWADNTLIAERAAGREPDPRARAAVEVARYYAENSALYDPDGSAAGWANTAAWNAVIAKNAENVIGLVAAAAAAHAGVIAADAAYADPLQADHAAKIAAREKQLADVRAVLARLQEKEKIKL